MNRIVMSLEMLLLMAFPPGLSRTDEPVTGQNDARNQLVERAAVVKPTAKELAWLTIPWVLDLKAAQTTAHAEHRPIFLWVTGDDPLERCWGYAAGLRAGPLSNEQVIRRVSQDFVPAAINLYRVRQANNGSRELFQSIQRQKDQYQGIWIVSPDGKVLAGRHDYADFKNGARELLETIDAGLKAFGPVEPRRVRPNRTDRGTTFSAETIADFLPFRGKGVRDDGNVDLALYVRQVLGGRRETIPPGVEPGRAWLWDGLYRGDGPPVIDTVTLTAEQWRTFSPPIIEAGAKWSVPDPVARQFTRLLTASSDQSAMPRPEDATLAELQCTVQTVSGGEARIELSGRWEMAHAIEHDKNRMQFGAATARGVAIYDTQAQMLRSFLLVFDGTVRHGRPDASPNRTGAVSEWFSQ